jgi:glycosyltransferase involved in cell wall biosynthesis
MIRLCDKPTPNYSDDFDHETDQKVSNITSTFTEKMLEKVTPLLLTYNEAPNIERTLKQLLWAKEIIVIDSYSTDATLDLLQIYPQVKIFQREFDSFEDQCNYGLEQVNSEWVLSIDADYFVTDELLAEINALPGEPHCEGYFANFKYCVFGKPLRGAILPPRQVLYRKTKAHYHGDGHAHRVRVDGPSGMLVSFIHHDDRKPLSRWLWSQNRYMVIEAQKLLETPVSELSFGDRLRRQKLIAPFIILLYCLVLKGGLLDGWHGWYYAFQRMFAEILLSIHLIQTEQFAAHES